MRWDRLFGELEGHAEHASLEERDAMVADLRDGEWAERSWIDGLQGGDAEVDVAVRGLGVLSGRVRLANDTLVHLEAATGDHVVSAAAVQWVRGDARSPGLARDSVAARLGWGPILREAQDEENQVRLTLADGTTVEGLVDAVGRDFVRVVPATGAHRDVLTSAINVASFPRQP